jgi:hypothetical protein
MIAVAQDADGLRTAALELLEEAFDAPERARIERMAENSGDPESVRAVNPVRTLAHGYYLWLGYVAGEIEQPLEAGVTFRDADLDAGELLGLSVLREARAEFRRKHPPCQGCGTPQRNEWDKMCGACRSEMAKRAKN